MDLQLVEKGFGFAGGRKKWLISFALIGISSYGAYRVCHLPSLTSKRKRLLKLLGALFSVAEMVSDSADTVAIISKDLKEFLQSNSDQIPNSLKQLSKIARSEEFSESLVRVTETMTIGILRGYRLETVNDPEEGTNSSFPDRVVDKLTSKAGTGFVSFVAGSFARNLVLAFYSNSQREEGSQDNDLLFASHTGSNSSSIPGWVNIISSEKCKEVIAECIRTFVSTAVAVYLDSTMDINFCDELFSGLTNPKHHNEVRDFFVSICKGAVETLVKTSREVLTISKHNQEPSSLSACSIVEHSTKSSTKLEELSDQGLTSTKPKEKSASDGIHKSEWMSALSSTLAVPSNRRLVLDVTGRVTFETMRSLVEFFLWKLANGLKRSLNVVHDEVVERGVEVVRYVGAKSSVIVTICLALYLHILTGSRALLPA